MADNIEKKPLVHSDAWPEQKDQAAHSKIHDILKQDNLEINKDEIQYRLLEQSDIAEVKNLHLEWFPLRYDDDYYSTIGKYAHTIAIGAFYKPRGHKAKRLLLGAILTRLQYDDSVSDTINKRRCCYKFCRTFNFWHVPDLILYIMTIGVVDEVRRMGIGSELIEQSMKIAWARFPECQGVSLHVIEYNNAAIGFYRKKGYKELEKIEKYYTINEKQYAAYRFGILFNLSAIKKLT